MNLKTNIMKKLLLSAAFVCAAIIGANAQVVLSQTGGTAATDGTIACGNNQAPTTSENSFYRSYTISGGMTTIHSVKVGIGTAIGGVPITVNLYKSTGAFPGSYPNGLSKVASGTITLTTNNNPSTVEVNLTTPLAVTAGDIIVAEVHNLATNTGNAYYPGVVETSETAPAYIRAAGCSINTPTTFAAVSPTANGKMVIDLIEKDPASSADFFTENFTIYPNPVADVLNIESKNGLTAGEIKITDMTGKVVKTQKDAASVNVSDLTAGTYIIDITTNEGKATSKFIKNNFHK